MTNEQREKLAAIGKQIQEILLDFHGNIRFNITPERKIVNFNLEQSFIEKPTNGNERKNV